MRNPVPIFGIVGLATMLALGGDLHFYVEPYQVYDGGAMQFHYVPNGGIPLDRIRSWAWDFDGNGTVDAHGEDSTGINLTWYAKYDANRATNDVCRYTPILKVVDIVGAEHVQTGVTEHVFGLYDHVNESVSVLKYNARDTEISVNFSGGPRLAALDQKIDAERKRTEEIRFFSHAELLMDGTIMRQHWNLGDGTELDGASVRHAYTNVGEYAVSLTVDYVINSNKSETKQMTETKMAYITVQNDMGNLSLGRAYRKGYPSEYTWEDIIKAYSQRSINNNQYVYYEKFELAYNEGLNRLLGNPKDPVNRLYVAEAVNELLQGQVMLGNDRLVDALRLKYPRMVDYDPMNPPETLPKPPGVREETKAIDVALLDYYAALVYPASVIQRYGPTILRSRATPGAEPYPNFPQYLTFLDPTLSPNPVPIKNEYWQYATCLERMALGSYEKAKKLFNLSLTDEKARDEAKAVCKTTAMQSYLGMALLAACQNEKDFAMNDGNLVLSHLSNVRNLFEVINAGLNPLIDNGDYIPNESFAAIYQDAQEAVSDVLEAEVKARQEEKTWDSYQAELRNELLAQRNNYITPLYNLTHIDPELYNNLATIDDQIDYRNTIKSRVKLIGDNYPQSDPAAVGELGSYICNTKLLEKSLEQAQNNLNNIYERIDIRTAQATEVVMTQLDYGLRLMVYDLMKGMAEGMMEESVFSLQAIAGGIEKGSALAGERMLELMKSVEIEGINVQADIKSSLLDTANAQIEIEKVKNQIKLSDLELDNVMSRIDRMIEDLAHTRDTAADLYFNDPSYRVVVSEAMQRAESEMDYAIDKLYRLAKTLEYWWAEPYRNPISVPVFCNEPASLENPLFDQFTQLESLFNITCADEAKDYLDALKAWDSKLRRISLTSVRGPNNAGPITAEPISLREDILGFRTDNGTLTMNESITAFRNYLDEHRTEGLYNVWNPSLEVHFPLEIEDNKYFPATGERWNMRIDSIAIDIYAESGFSKKQVAEVSLTEAGTVSIRRFWAEPGADDVMKLSHNVGVRADRTAYEITVPSKINGATGNRPAAEFLAYGLQGRPVAATDWILKIDTDNPSNKDIDFSKIKDIVIRFTYTYGNPQEFPGF